MEQKKNQKVGNKRENKNIRISRVRTVFSVTTENLIGIINDAPPPIDIPWARATCQSSSNYLYILLSSPTLQKDIGNVCIQIVSNIC